MKTIEYVMYLLSIKDFSQTELRTKAAKKDFPPTEIEDALQYVTTQNFQSDERLASNIIQFYMAAKGQVWIRAKCRRRGIEAETFETAWKIVQEDDNLQKDTQFESLRQTVMRKYKITDFSGLDPKIMHKIHSFLAYRGFNPYQMLEKWRGEEY